MNLRIEERILPDAASSEKTKENALSQMGKTSHWEIFRDPAQLQKMWTFSEQQCSTPFTQRAGSRWRRSEAVVQVSQDAVSGSQGEHARAGGGLGHVQDE